MDINERIAETKVQLKNLKEQEKAVANGVDPQTASVQVALKHPVTTSPSIKQRPKLQKHTNYVEAHYKVTSPARLVKHTSKLRLRSMSKVEDVYHALLALGLSQNSQTDSNSNHTETTTNILMILKKYNCLAMAMETMNQLYHNGETIYQIKPNLSNQWLPYDITSPYTIDPQHAKYAIEQALLNRVSDSVYYTFNCHEMKYYNDLPSVFKQNYNIAPMLLVWLLHHYGFDDVIEDIIFRDKAPLRKGHINGKAFSYFSEQDNTAPLKLSVIGTPNSDALFDIRKKLNKNSVPF